MKKVILVVSLAILTLVAGIAPISAMTKAEFKEKVEKTYVINGAEFGLSNDMKVLFERYMDEYKVSSADMDYVSAVIDKAVNIIKKSGKTKLADLDAATKKELKGLVEDISANTSIKATVKNGKLIIYKPDGSIFAEIDSLVKQTGLNANPMAVYGIIAFVVMAFGAFYITKKMRVCE